MPANQIQYSEKYYDDVRAPASVDAIDRMQCVRCYFSMCMLVACLLRCPTDSCLWCVFPQIFEYRREPLLPNIADTM